MIALFTALLACSGGETTPAATPPAPVEPAPAAASPDVTRALELAAIVRADFANADAALTAKGSSRAELDALLYKIAADPVLSAAYAEGQRRP
jgi:hypothetical protein